MEVTDRQVLDQEWQLQPEDFIDLKALAGDPSDNIPGVPGIGPKTAIELLKKFDTLKAIYTTIIDQLQAKNLLSNFPFLTTKGNYNPNDNVENERLVNECKLQICDCKKGLEEIAKELSIKPRILELLIIYKEQAFLSQRLATICRDVPLNFNLEDCRWGSYNREDLKNFFTEMQFQSLLRRFGILKGEEPKTKEAKEQKEKDEQLKLL
jgi:DNA polymerase-1